MRRTVNLLRGAKGYGWYNKFVEKSDKGFKKYTPPTAFTWPEGPSPRPVAWFDIMAENEELGRLRFELAEDVVPSTVANFKALCRGDGDSKMTYEGTKFHRVQKGIAIQGGDVEKRDGTGNHSSATSRYIEDENFIIPHSERGLLSMVSVGVNTSGSQFTLALDALPHLNGRSVVFARLIEGEKVLEAIESIFTFRGTPAKEIRIVKAGLE
jgi:cyclophilin family peptidyl-prolyl cis-trans isomerase